jgi:hypothetical protein
MTKRKRPRDPSQLAKLIVDIAAGEVEDRPPTPEEQGKDSAATSLGKRGGLARAKRLGAVQNAVYGEPDPAHISTSFAERSNLTMRMNMRRFTRLTNAFSKKIENHAHAVALHMILQFFPHP